MTAPNIALGLVTLVIVVAGVYLVLTRNMVHAALSLMLVLAGVAGAFILLGAEFLGWTQVLVYIGAIVVLFMFGVMLTKARLVHFEDLDAPPAQRALAAGVAALLFALFTYTFVTVFGGQELRVEPKPVAAERSRDVLDRPTTAKELGDELFENWVLPFEAVSVVLLAALIGAIVLARRDDAEHTKPRVERLAKEVTA